MLRPLPVLALPKANRSPVAILMWSPGPAQAGGTTMTLYMDSSPRPIP
jgi:hypothetical protein